MICKKNKDKQDKQDENENKPKKKKKKGTNNKNQSDKDGKDDYTCEFSIARSNFKGMVDEISDGFRFTEQAIHYLHVVYEQMCIGAFTDINECALHAKRITIQPKDVQFYFEKMICAGHRLQEKIRDTVDKQNETDGQPRADWRS